MKKILTIVVASLIFSGCVTNGSWDDEPSEIRMVAVGKVANKAIVEGAVIPDGFDFTVFGFYSTDSFATTPSQFEMYDVDCTKQGEYYKNASESYYWPWIGEVGFYAVSPASLASTASWANGVVLADYTVVGAEDVDVMFAYNKGSNRATSLNMVFYHALSQVEVLVKTKQEYANATLAITGVTFKNIDVTANCSFKEDSPADTTANPSVTWMQNTDHTASEVYKAVEQTVAYNGGVAQPYGTGIVVIPQTMGATSVMSIDYTLTQNGNTVIGVADVPITTNWDARNKYIYTVIFALDKIQFDPSATGWVSVTTDAITLD